MDSKKTGYQLLVLGSQLRSSLRRNPKFLAWLRGVTVDEVGCGRPLLSLYLYFKQSKRSLAAAPNQEEAALVNHDFTCRQHALHRLRSPNVQILSAKAGVCARPGLEATQPIQDFMGGKVKINPAVFFFQDGSQCRLAVILGPRLNRAGLQPAKSFNHEVGSDRSHSRGQRFGGVLGRNWNFFLQQDTSGVEPGIDPHGGYTANRFATGDGPLDWRSPAVFGQQ